MARTTRYQPTAKELQDKRTNPKSKAKVNKRVKLSVKEYV